MMDEKRGRESKTEFGGERVGNYDGVMGVISV
jgi:hypothetical protein